MAQKRGSLSPGARSISVIHPHYRPRERLVGYKRMHKPNQRAIATNLIGPEALVSYLSQVGAELVRAGPVTLRLVGAQPARLGYCLTGS
jgi:hypothetical protein